MPATNILSAERADGPVRSADQFAASFPVEVIAANDRGNDKGEVDAIVSVFGVDYSMGFTTKHRILPGAFDGSLRKQDTVPIFWQHSWAFSEQPPIGTGKASVRSNGLKVKASMFLDTDAGRSTFKAIKAGALRQWSIGYRILKWREERTDDGRVIIIEEAELLEASSVLRGANPGTETERVASEVAAASAGTPRIDVDRIARKHGMPDPDELSPALRAALDRSRGSTETADDGPCTSLATWKARLRDHWMQGVAVKSCADLAREWLAPSLAETGSPTTFQQPFGGEVSYKPEPPGLMDLVTGPLPHDAGTIKSPVMSWTDGTGSTQFGTLVPDIGITSSGGTKKLAWFPLSAKQDSDVLTDVGVGLEAMLVVLRRTIRALLNRALLTANGTDDFYGALEVAGTQQLNGSGLSALQVLTRGARMIHDAGFSGPLAVIGHPSTVDQVFLGRTVREEVPAITTYIPSNQMPFGSCVIGDFAAACTLYLGSLLLTSSPSDEVNFRLSRVTFLAETRAHAAWNQPNAVVEVTGVASS